MPFFTLQEAERLGLSGSVRNRQDGSVEVIAQGSEQQLQQLREWLAHGPKTAKVERIIENEYRIATVFERFLLLR